MSLPFSILSECGVIRRIDDGGHHQTGYFLDNQRCWLVDYGGSVHRTLNGGVSWTQEWVTPWPQGWVSDISLRPDGPIWVCGAHSTLLVNVEPFGVPGAENWSTPFAFLPPAPNPLVDFTRLCWDLQEPGRVQCSVFDVRGRLMKRLLDVRQPSGRHEVIWNGNGDGGRRLPGGVYFVRIQVNNQSRSQRVILR